MRLCKAQHHHNHRSAVYMLIQVHRKTLFEQSETHKRPYVEYIQSSLVSLANVDREVTSGENTFNYSRTLHSAILSRI